MLSSLGISLLLAAAALCCRRAPGAPGVALTSWATACQFGRLVVRKGSLEVNDSTCDWIYPKEDWQPPQPFIQYPEAKESETYTVFAIDPDAPNHPNGTYYLHMLQANIKGDDLKSGDFSNALTIASYAGPGPPPGTGLHRYMFIVYRHSPGFKVKEQPTPQRWMWDFGKWISSSGKGLSGPDAGSQFRSGP